MGFKFRKRLKVMPGVYMNFGKNGLNSWSLFGYNTKSKKTTINVPIKGVSYTIDHKKNNRVNNVQTINEMTRATIQLSREDMEYLKMKTGSKTNKEAVLKCVKLVLSELKKS